ncbi:WG repeat-containing protein [Pseudobacteroides cellulosolvens]|uniref:Copper amine oxidase-like domain-containing protein n=1 Tax=Pseudobacteroides cellulosolvens ATCC 35603 = DSM 2933 TaxID=398512 RepID=A0A0L6JN66_9FIRM|nr:WG repeat-containing protein [Pseudobacteroides cellulosolvens]KNY27228.1 copper amine oxidase-like domain-containing protein [Pseudobacteroides cellulosolvens ATCC 35603 = DSM 2933]
MIKKIIMFAIIADILLINLTAFAQDGAMWNWVAEPQYTSAVPQKDGFAAVSRAEAAELANGGEKFGLINENGELVVPMEYSWVGISDGDVLAVSKTVYREEGDTDGYNIGTSGEMPIITKEWSVGKDGILTLIKPKLDRSDWTWELFAGKDAIGFRSDDKDSHVGVKNKVTGEIIIPAVYDQITPFSEGYAVARNYDQGMGIIDNKNNIIIPLEYNIWHAFINQQLLGPDEHDELSEMRGNDLTCGISKDGKWGLINRKGEWVIPITYDSLKENTPMGESETGVAQYSGGIAAAKKNGKWGIIDIQGRLITPIEYENAFVDDGFASVMKNGKWGSVDKEGKIIIPFEYDGIRGYSEGRIFVRKSGFWGIVDSDGKSVAPLIYDNIYPFKNGYAVVEKNSKRGLVKLDGSVALPAVYDDIWAGETINMASVKSGDKWGYAKLIETVGEDTKALTKASAIDKKYINMQIGNPNANLSAFLTQIDKNDKNVVPIIKDNRTFLPIRFISETLNGKIDWLPDEQKIIIVKDNKNIELVIGINTATVNGKSVTLDAAPIIENSRTLLPIRFIAETLGCKVEWNSNEKIVTIIEN